MHPIELIVNESYYFKTLSAERLKRCYDLAPARTRAFLESEIGHARGRIEAGARVLELGCGYGRILRGLSAAGASLLAGVDISLSSLGLARKHLSDVPNTAFFQMNALDLGFAAQSFDVVLCLQNGVSSFHVDQRALFETALKVTKRGGTALFSSYAEEFWEVRLQWFRIQAAHGLIGEIDESRTGNGVIVCRDGFMVTTVRPQQFAELAQGLGTSVSISTVDKSSVFCEIEK